MPKITVHEGKSFDPYVFPELQPVTGPKIVETDIKEVADQDEDTKYVEAKDEEGDDTSAGQTSSTSESKLDETGKKNSAEGSETVPSAVRRLRNSRA